MEHLDAIVLGAGSAGAAVARRLAKAGLSVVLVEPARVGGECPFVSCMPSKALLRSAQFRHLAGRDRELGATSASATPDEDGSAFALAVRRRDEIVHHRDDSAKTKELEDLGVRVLRGRGKVARPGVVVVDGIEYGYVDLVVSTGSSPVWPPVEGLDTVATWTSDQALVSSQRPESMIILGGGPVGCELAQVYVRFGTRVTLVDGASGLLGPEEPSIAKRLADVLETDGVDLRLSTQVIGAESGPDGVRLRLDTGSILDSERVLVAAGRSPNTSQIGLETLGIQECDGGLDIDETCRVRGHRNMWAAGDVTAVAPYTHTANYQAEIIATNILGSRERTNPRGEQIVADYRAIPRAVYTDPAVASVGMHEATAMKRGIDTVTASLELEDLARSRADGDGGRVVLTADRSRSILIGAAAIGPHADEWIGEAALAIHAEVPLSVLVQLVHLFPTYSEVYGRLFRDLVKKAT
jgi:pyruvate/2-oxoglutarate dehydrogenase complex dihydrolipoamide dehydrogenase (E3) component